jgi:hypothetical protein
MGTQLLLEELEVWWQLVVCSDALDILAGKMLKYESGDRVKRTYRW